MTTLLFELTTCTYKHTHTKKKSYLRPSTWLIGKDGLISESFSIFQKICQITIQSTIILKRISPKVFHFGSISQINVPNQYYEHILVICGYMHSLSIRTALIRNNPSNASILRNHDPLNFQS